MTQTASSMENTVIGQLATICYATVPTVYLRKFIDAFPCEEGDFVMNATALHDNVFQVQVYVAHWHLRETQIVFLVQQSNSLAQQGYHSFRHWQALAERKYIGKRE